MCGILGMTPPGDPERFRSALALLRHRGPDDGGVHEDGGIALGHRRLSILDVSPSGHQPMSYADGRYWIAYNGEVYNFVELRRELEALGHRFRSEGDTEVVLAAYAQWGPACFLRFNGMWALAIWDARERRLVLSRDRFGKKPLFYTQDGGRFTFASEMKALAVFQDRPAPDLALVREAARDPFCYESTGRCLVAGIRRFPAGHHGVVEPNGTLVLTRYWDTLDHLPEVPDRYEEQVERFRELFTDACRIRMRSDVAIGTALSGGLDSSSVIATIAQVARAGGAERTSADWQHAFVATFPGAFLDEAVHARRVVDHLGIGATYVQIDPLECIDRLGEYLYLTEELYLTSPIPFMLTYAAMRARGVKVTIDGHGADELFGGYPWTVLEALKDVGWNPLRARGVTAAFEGMFQKGRPQVRVPRGGVERWARGRLRWLWEGARGGRRRPADPRLARMGHLNRALFDQTHRTILPTLLRNYDRYSMANGVELRMPFMDHRIVTFAFALPWTSKVRMGFAKAIVRDAVAPLLPAAIAWRKDKIGFNSPIVDWIRGPLKAFVSDTVAEAGFRTCALVDAASAEAKVRKVVADSNATFQDGERAWAAIVPYLWQKAMFERPPAPTPPAATLVSG